MTSGDVLLARCADLAVAAFERYSDAVTLQLSAVVSPFTGQLAHVDPTGEVAPTDLSGTTATSSCHGAPPQRPPFLMSPRSGVASCCGTTGGAFRNAALKSDADDGSRLCLGDALVHAQLLYALKRVATASSVGHPLYVAADVLRVYEARATPPLLQHPERLILAAVMLLFEALSPLQDIRWVARRWQLLERERSGAATRETRRSQLSQDSGGWVPPAEHYAHATNEHLVAKAPPDSFADTHGCHELPRWAVHWITQAFHVNVLATLAAAWEGGFRGLIVVLSEATNVHPDADLCEPVLRLPPHVQPALVLGQLSSAEVGDAAGCLLEYLADELPPRDSGGDAASSSTLRGRRPTGDEGKAECSNIQPGGGRPVAGEASADEHQSSFLRRINPPSCIVVALWIRVKQKQASMIRSAAHGESLSSTAAAPLGTPPTADDSPKPQFPRVDSEPTSLSCLPADAASGATLRPLPPQPLSSAVNPKATRAAKTGFESLLAQLVARDAKPPGHATSRVESAARLAALFLTLLSPSRDAGAIAASTAPEGYAPMTPLSSSSTAMGGAYHPSVMPGTGGVSSSQHVVETFRQYLVDHVVGVALPPHDAAALRRFLAHNAVAPRRSRRLLQPHIMGGHRAAIGVSPSPQVTVSLHTSASELPPLTALTSLWHGAIRDMQAAIAVAAQPHHHHTTPQPSDPAASVVRLRVARVQHVLVSLWCAMTTFDEVEELGRDVLLQGRMREAFRMCRTFLQSASPHASRHPPDRCTTQSHDETVHPHANPDARPSPNPAHPTSGPPPPVSPTGSSTMGEHCSVRQESFAFAPPPGASASAGGLPVAPFPNGFVPSVTGPPREGGGSAASEGSTASHQLSTLMAGSHVGDRRTVLRALQGSPFATSSSQRTPHAGRPESVSSFSAAAHLADASSLLLLLRDVGQSVLAALGSCSSEFLKVDVHGRKARRVGVSLHSINGRLSIMSKVCERAFAAVTSPATTTSTDASTGAGVEEPPPRNRIAFRAIVEDRAELAASTTAALRLFLTQEDWCAVGGGCHPPTPPCESPDNTSCDVAQQPSQRHESPRTPSGHQVDSSVCLLVQRLAQTFATETVCLGELVPPDSSRHDALGTTVAHTDGGERWNGSFDTRAAAMASNAPPRSSHPTAALDAPLDSTLFIGARLALLSSQTALAHTVGTVLHHVSNPLDERSSFWETDVVRVSRAALFHRSLASVCLAVAMIVCEDHHHQLSCDARDASATVAAGAILRGFLPPPAVVRKPLSLSTSATGFRARRVLATQQGASTPTAAVTGVSL